MTAIEGRPHRKGQIVTCTIERILPFGVFVRLEDSSRGYIRRRELSLSGDQEAMSEFKLGDSVTAVIVEPESPGRTLELSRRAALPDPWLDFARNFRIGSTVEGTVKRLTNNGADIEILPGVDGFAPLAELAPWPISAPNDVLWLGDHIKATIVHISPVDRRIRLSLKQCLERAAFTQSVLDTLLEYDSHAYKENLVAMTPSDPTPEQDFDPIELKAPVLVVEDMIDVREPLVKWLNDRGCEAHGTQSSLHALQLCQERCFALVLVDLDMPALDGTGLVRELRQRGIGVPVAIMSDPSLIAQELPVLQSFDIATTFPKPLDLRDVHELLVCLASGERPNLDTKAHFTKPSSEVQSLQGLAKLALIHSPIEERLHNTLQQIVEDTNATIGIIFHLDPVSRQVTIVARTGDIPLQMDALYGLRESPVKDVIVEEQLILENHVSRERLGQFRKLLELFPFESCIAVPLGATSHTEHALFLFQRAEGAFLYNRLRDAITAGALLAAILESQALDERVRSLSGLFLSGQLAAGFGHEVRNQLASLDLQFQNLSSDIDRAAREYAELAGLDNFVAVQNAVEQAIRTSKGLRRTVTEFTRLMESRDDHIVDVNQVVHQAELMIRTVARNAKVNVRLNLPQGLPAVVGNSLGLQQVFLNLLLNSVQHMERKRHALRLLTVSTSCRGVNSDQWVQARFSDTGPGIHHQLWKSVFTLGFTTRPGGSGLGLYIAESLVNNMGGRICIESSLVPLGTTFLVELPVGRVNGSDKP